LFLECADANIRLPMLREELPVRYRGGGGSGDRPRSGARGASRESERKTGHPRIVSRPIGVAIFTGAGKMASWTTLR